MRDMERTRDRFKRLCELVKPEHLAKLEVSEMKKLYADVTHDTNLISTRMNQLAKFKEHLEKYCDTEQKGTAGSMKAHVLPPKPIYVLPFETTTDKTRTTSTDINKKYLGRNMKTHLYSKKVINNLFFRYRLTSKYSRQYEHGSTRGNKNR